MAKTALSLQRRSHKLIDLILSYPLEAIAPTGRCALGKADLQVTLRVSLTRKPQWSQEASMLGSYGRL